MPRSAAKRKIEQIQFTAGHFCGERFRNLCRSERLAHELNGHLADQFTYAERATDWRQQ